MTTSGWPASSGKPSRPPPLITPQSHIYEVGKAEGISFIAMEFIDGTTLREKIHRDKADLKKLLGYLTQVAEGLARTGTQTATQL